MSPRPQRAPNSDRKATEARLSQELKGAREAYEISTERYKRIVGNDETLSSKKAVSSDLLIKAAIRAQLYATERYSQALYTYNRFLLEGELR